MVQVCGAWLSRCLRVQHTAGNGPKHRPPGRVLITRKQSTAAAVWCTSRHKRHQRLDWPRGIRIVQASPAALAALPGLFEVPTQPEPVRFPRKALDQAFAVLLLRSCYEAVDDLDFIPMEQFQVLFWKLRQAEYAPYILQYSPLRIRQGELTDPLYFDFITFAQAATISREMPRGRQVFEEYCEECEGQKRVVTRSAALQDNALLPAAFRRRAGDRIYTGLREGFNGQVFGGPSPCAPGAGEQQLLASVQAILDIFVARGYALKARVTTESPVSSSSSSSSSSDEWGAGGPASQAGFRVQLNGPTNLWGLAALASRRAVIDTAHDALAIAAFLRASGCQDVSYRLRRNDTFVQEDWSYQL